MRGPATADAGGVRVPAVPRPWTEGKLIRKSRAVMAAATVTAAIVAAPASAAPPAPIDPQNWSFQDNLTWGDYKPIPGPDYSDPTVQPTVKKWRVALILVDFDDRPFTISQPAGARSSARRPPPRTVSRASRSRSSTRTS